MLTYPAMIDSLAVTRKTYKTVQHPCKSLQAS